MVGRVSLTLTEEAMASLLESDVEDIPGRLESEGAFEKDIGNNIILVL